MSVRAPAIPKNTSGRLELAQWIASPQNPLTSRVMVNQPQAASNSGNLWNGMRQTFSLGCGSWGGNGTNNNITWRDLINETWVSKPLVKTKELLSDEELFGPVMARMG